MNDLSPNTSPCEWCQHGYCDRSDRSGDIDSEVFLDSQCTDRCCSQGACKGQQRHDTIDEESPLDTAQLTADSSFHEHMKDAAEDSTDMKIGKLHVPNVLKYLSCGSKDKTRLTDEDNEPYGFNDMPSMKYKQGRQTTQSNEGKETEALNVPANGIGIQESSPHDKPETDKRMYTKRPRTRHKDGAKTASPNEYDFSHEKRGYMVMIVNDRFKKQDDRDGAFRDIEYTRHIARKFGFIIFNYGHERNLTKAETISILRKAQRANHSDCDCFAFLISSHGLEQRNPRANGKKDHSLVCSDDQLIFTSSILEMFDDDHCPSLKGKPKLFFIQACRGEDLDHGTDVLVAFPRLPLDKTCGVTVPASQPTRGRPFRRKDTVDETDTLGGPDSWAVFPSTSTSTTLDPLGLAGSVSPPLAGTGQHLSPQGSHRYSDTAKAQIVNENELTTSTFLIVEPPAQSSAPSVEDLHVPGVPPVNRLPPYPQFYLPKFPPKTQIMPSPSPVRAINVDRSPSKFLSDNGSVLPSFLNLDLNLHVAQPLKATARSPRERSPVPSPSGYQTNDTPSLTCSKDMLVLYAIPQGMFAWRSVSDGSWMVYYLHEVLMAYDMRKPRNFLNMLTKVNALMSRRETRAGDPSKSGKKTVSVIEHALTKDIFFQQKVPISEWVKRSHLVAV